MICHPIPRKSVTDFSHRCILVYMPLTDRAIRNLKPLDRDKFYADGNGLYLRVKSSGAKVFLYRRQVKPRARWITLGKYPDLSLADARRRVMELAKSEVPEIITVKDAYAAWLSRYVVKHYKRPSIITQRFEANVGEAWFKKPLGSITKVSVSNLLQTVVDRGAPVMANRLLADIKHFFDYAVERGWLEYNPAASITRKTVGGKEKPKDRALSFDELERFLPELQRSPRLHLQTKLALALTLITGQRPGEVLTIRPADVDNRHWWHLRTTKAGRPHRVFLSVQARVLLRIAIKYFGDTPFSSDHRALSHALRRILPEAGLDPFTPHDLRRTMATRLSDVGVMPHVIEKMLNHKMEGVMAVYNLSEYLPEREAAWVLWGSKLAELRRKKGRVSPRP